MTLQVKTSIIINATADKVWNVFSNFNAYPEWNPFVKSLKGDVKVGNTIAITLPDMNFKPEILVFEKDKELRWIGKLLFKGVFDGEHYFQLKDNGNGTTTFIHGENFNGFLVGLFKKKLTTDTKAGFESMNEALKKRVEDIE